MKDADCVAFLQWALPRLGLRWSGFRKVRRQVCKRIGRRMASLSVSHVDEYRNILTENEQEWAALDGLCRITISRFYRDRAVFDGLKTLVFPRLARARSGDVVRCWSAGCASGEEAYTLAILWRLDPPRGGQPPITILATDADASMLERAKVGCYGPGSLRDAPVDWPERAFVREGDCYCVQAPFRAGIEFRLHDLRASPPAEGFDLVLCRNLAFTYFDQRAQATALDALLGCLATDGYLVIGRRERVPRGAPLVPYAGHGEILHRIDIASSSS